MGPSKPSGWTGQVAWPAVAAVSVLAPHAALPALGTVVAAEMFGLLRARSLRTSTLAYLREAGPRTQLRIGSSSAAPELSLITAGLTRPGRHEEGQPLMPEEQPDPVAWPDTDPAEFCIRHRHELLRYAFTLTRNWHDAEDAVSEAVLKLLDHHAQHQKLPAEPAAWAKTVIRNYVTDRYRRKQTELRHSHELELSPEDSAEVITDLIMADQARQLLASLAPRDFVIACLRWIEDMKPRQIAQQMDLPAPTVRTSLHRTTKMIRRRLGVPDPRQVLQERTA